MFPIIFTEDALLDVFVATDYYEFKSPGLGERFSAKIYATCGFIQLQPYAWPEKMKGTREIVVKGFPYVVIYNIEDSVIFILRVFPCKMNPSKKTSKKR